jgi:hypothetical protein
MWRFWLTDARTGMLVHPIDISSFSWSMSVSDFGFSSTPKDKNLGDESVDNLTIPWSAFNADTQAERANLLAQGRRGLCVSWWYEGCADDRGIPLMWGVLGERQDRWDDVTFPLISPLTLLDSRLAVRENEFKTGKSTNVISFNGLSLRGLAAELGYVGVQAKNGGQLPIDWNYRGERGNHQRTNYQAWNIQNLSLKHLLTNLSNVQGGPDMAFRPYWADVQHVRIGFMAGSDGDVYLAQDHQPVTLNAFPGGGSLEGMTVDYALPYQRVYASGSGTDAATVTAYAEDMSQITGQYDPPILRELAWSDTDVDKSDLLLSKARAVLNANHRPLMQMCGYVNVDDLRADGYPQHPLGSFWPGEQCYLDLNGHPTLPDGRYVNRLMEMSGDESARVLLKFDVMEAPL